MDAQEIVGGKEVVKFFECSGYNQLFSRFEKEGGVIAFGHKKVLPKEIVRKWK